MKRLEGLLVPCGILALMLSGCGGDAGPKMAPVTGTVLLDGQPVEGADVKFMAKEASHAASGKTDAQGKFSLKTMEKQGAVLGSHTVTIVKYEASGGTDSSPDDYLEQMGGAPPAMPKSLLPIKYSRPVDSGLSATVAEDGANDFTFELTSGK